MPRNNNAQGRSRGWVYTLNNYTAEDIDLVKLIECRFHIFAKEIGESLTPHLQGFIYFPNALRLSSLRTKFLPAKPHFEKMMGTVQQAADYCRKEWLADMDNVDQPWSKGSQPLSQRQKGLCTKEQFAETWAHAKAGEIDSIIDKYPDLALRYYGTILKIRRDFQVRPENLKRLDNIWVWGNPETGKSEYVRTLGTYYVKSLNKWWLQYHTTKEPNVILEEFGRSHACLGHHIKLWADKYPFMAEDKNGGGWLRPSRIFVTSNYSIEQIWPDDKQMQLAVKRRFKVIHAIRTPHLSTFGYLWAPGGALYEGDQMRNE